MSRSYSPTHYFPPIPVLQVRIYRLGSAMRTDGVEATVDTGADMTIAPAELMEQMEALRVIETDLVSQWGDLHSVTLYLVDLEIENLLLPGIYIAGDETASEIILGRNVLNKLPLFLDGPEQQTELLDDATVKRLRARQKPTITYEE